MPQARALNLKFSSETVRFIHNKTQSPLEWVLETNLISESYVNRPGAPKIDLIPGIRSEDYRDTFHPVGASAQERVLVEDATTYRTSATLYI